MPRSNFFDEEDTFEKVFGRGSRLKKQAERPEEELSLSKRLLQDFEDILTVLSDDGVDRDDEIRTKVKQKYESYVATYRPLVNGIPVLLEKVFKDLLPLITSFVDLQIVIRSDDVLQQSLLELTRLKAKMRFEVFKSYCDVGFTSSQAMSLLLQDIANFEAGIHSLSDTASSARKKKA